MTIKHPILLGDIDGFLIESGMSETYFGKASAGNSELVSRLRAGGRVWPETEAKIRAFILHRKEKLATKRGSAKADIQGAK